MSGGTYFNNIPQQTRPLPIEHLISLDRLEPHVIMHEALQYPKCNLPVVYFLECGENEFSCGSGECVPKYARCNGVTNCEDGSDELACSCEPEEFKCDSGLACIPKEKVCNGVRDCSDATDENHCGMQIQCEVLKIRHWGLFI